MRNFTIRKKEKKGPINWNECINDILLWEMVSNIVIGDDNADRIHTQIIIYS